MEVNEDFTPPTKVEVSIKKTSSGDGFGCPEGCAETMSSFTAMHEHCFIGNHSYVLQQMTTYDMVKLRWYDACVNLSEKLNISRSDVVQPDSTSVQDHIKETLGWALKRDKKHSKFSEKVKNYLKTIFEEGEKSGRKMNANVVARNMRVFNRKK